MNLIDKYRSIKDHKEILRILQHSESGSENFLWQNINEKKIILSILRMEIDFISREVVVEFEQTKKIYEDCPIFVKLDFKQSIFKVTEFIIKKNVLHFTFPSHLKALEMRTTERITFDIDDERKIKLQAPSQLKQGSQGLFVRVLDVSKTGMGLMISESGRTYFKNNPKLLLTSLGDQELEGPVMVETVYINSEVPQRYRYRKGQELKVGIRFMTPILEQDLLSFLS
jgi:hypothetical protein